MCLAVPGRVERIEQHHGEPVGIVDFAGTTREVALSFLPGIAPGDWVIAHAGVAIQRLDEDAAAETLRLLDQLGDAEGGEP